MVAASMSMESWVGGKTLVPKGAQPRGMIWILRRLNQSSFKGSVDIQRLNSQQHWWTSRNNLNFFNTWTQDDRLHGELMQLPWQRINCIYCTVHHFQYAGISVKTLFMNFGLLSSASWNWNSDVFGNSCIRHATVCKTPTTLHSALHRHDKNTAAQIWL